MTEDVKRDDTRLDFWGSNGSPDPSGLIWEIRIPERGDPYHQDGRAKRGATCTHRPQTGGQSCDQGCQTGHHLPGLSGLIWEPQTSSGPIWGSTHSPVTRGVKRDATCLDFRGSSGSPKPCWTHLGVHP